MNQTSPALITQVQIWLTSSLDLIRLMYPFHFLPSLFLFHSSYSKKWKRTICKRNVILSSAKNWWNTGRMSLCLCLSLYISVSQSDFVSVRVTVQPRMGWYKSTCHVLWGSNSSFLSPYNYVPHTTMLYTVLFFPHTAAIWWNLLYISERSLGILFFFFSSDVKF